MIMPHSKVVGFKDRRATESVVALLKAAAKQNNVKLGKRKAGLLPAAFLSGKIITESQSPRGSWKCLAAVSFHTKYIKLPQE